MSAEDRIYDFSKLKSISKKILAGDMQLNNLLVRYITQTKKKNYLSKNKLMSGDRKRNI